MSNYIKLLMPCLALVFFSCKKSDLTNNAAKSSFKINSDEYALANAYYSVDSLDDYTSLVITSSTLIALC